MIHFHTKIKEVGFFLICIISDKKFKVLIWKISYKGGSRREREKNPQKCTGFNGLSKACPPEICLDNCWQRMVSRFLTFWTKSLTKRTDKASKKWNNESRDLLKKENTLHRVGVNLGKWLKNQIQNFLGFKCPLQVSHWLLGVHSSVNEEAEVKLWSYLLGV